MVSRRRSGLDSLPTGYPTFMSDVPSSPRIPDSELALRIALVQEMTEAARAGAIGWSIRDRRLRNAFHIGENSRAFDSRYPGARR